MLVKCPKCGFDQPKDTYCAKCGIEMSNYRPHKAPLLKRIVRSPLFYLSSFIALAYGTYFYMQTAHLPEPALLSKTTPPVIAAQGSPEPTDTPHAEGPSEVETHAPSATPTPPPMHHSSELKQAEQSSSSTQVAPTQPIPATPQPTEAEASQSLALPESSEKSLDIESIKGPLQLEVRFVEAPLPAVQQFLAEASDESGGDTGEMSFAIVKNSARWLRQRALIELDRFSKKVPTTKKKLQWFNGYEHPETGATIGLNFQVTIQERHGGHLMGDLLVTRSFIEFKDGGLRTTKKDFSTRFETDVNSLIGLAGVMPHTSIASQERDWLQDSLLKIYLSPSFLENESELMILLQFKADSK